MRDLTPADHATVHELLQAFHDDPAYRYVFLHDVREGLEFLMPRLLDLRLAAGCRGRIYERDGRILGFTLLCDDRLAFSPFAYLKAGLLRAPSAIGMQATMRLMNLGPALQRLRNLARDGQPFEEVITLVVHPEARRQGIGTALLQDLPTDRRIVLLTTDMHNVLFYQAVGFEVVVQDGIESSFTAWVMARQPSILSTRRA